MSAWPLAPIDEIFDIARGGSPRPIDAYLTDDPDGVNWIMISDATESGKYINTTKKRIRQEGAKRSRAVEPGDFLLTNSMSFGRPYIVNTRGCIHDGWLVLSPRRKLSTDFFYHVLGSEPLYREFERRASGLTVKNLNIDIVRNVQVPFPPLSEQRRIAAILDGLNELRRKRSQGLMKIGSAAASIFEQTFGCIVTNSRAWPVKALGSLVSEFRYGTSNKSSAQGNPALRIPNVIAGALDLQELKLVSVEPPEFERLRLLDGDLLFVRTNGNPDYVGRCAIFKTDDVERTGFNRDEFIFASYLIRARLASSDVTPIFVRDWLQTAEGRRQLRMRAKTSAGQFNINTESLGALPIPIPPVPRQRKYAEDIGQFEKLKHKYIGSLAKLDKLFAALQQRAFRGEL